MSTPVGLHLEFSTMHSPSFLEYLLGPHPPVEMKIAAFTAALRIVQEPRDDFPPPSQAVIGGVTVCHNYLLRSYLHRARFLDLGKQLLELTLASSSERRTGERWEQQEWEETRRVLAAQSEIEGLYFCLKLLLDRLATLFRYFFGIQGAKRTPGSAHENLRFALEKEDPSASGIRAVLPSSFLSRMQILSSKIIKFRNTEIEHVRDPHGGIAPTIWWDNGDNPNCVPQMPSMSADGKYALTENPSVFINLVEEYLAAALDFMTEHRDKSIFRVAS